MKKTSSRLVNCPICGLAVKSRGLHSHLRLVHPNSDTKKELRKKVISPNDRGATIKFQVSELITGDVKLKWANLDRDCIEMIWDICGHWLRDGHPMNSSYYNQGNFQTDTDSIGEGFIDCDEDDNRWDENGEMRLP